MAVPASGDNSAWSVFVLSFTRLLYPHIYRFDLSFSCSFGSSIWYVCNLFIAHTCLGVILIGTLFSSCFSPAEEGMSSLATCRGLCKVMVCCLASNGLYKVLSFCLAMVRWNDRLSKRQEHAKARENDENEDRARRERRNMTLFLLASQGWLRRHDDCCGHKNRESGYSSLYEWNHLSTCFIHISKLK